MAAKNGRDSSKDRDAGSAASAASADDDAGIRSLIDGAGSRETDRTDDTIGAGIGGNESTSGDGGSAGAGSGSDGGSGAAGSGEGAGSAAGTGKGRRTRNRSRSSGRSSSDAASQETRHPSDNFSRPLAPPKQPKIDIDADELPSTNAEVIGDVFQFAFWGIGQATGLPDEWELDDDDAKDIGKNGDKWLKSLGKKRAQNIVKGLSKIGPSLAFFGSVGMALVPRVRVTIQTAKHGAIRPIKTREGRSGPGSNQSASHGGSTATGSADPQRSAGSREVPFAAKDFSEVTQGFAGTDDGRAVS